MIMTPPLTDPDRARLEALEAQIAALAEEAELAKKYDISTPERLEFAREQARKEEEQRTRNREAVKRSRDAAKRREARRQELTAELVADGRIRIYTGPNLRPVRAPVGPDGGFVCPTCGAPARKLREMAADTFDRITVSNDALHLDLSRWGELCIQYGIRFPAVVRSDSIMCPSCRETYAARSLVVIDP